MTLIKEAHAEPIPGYRLIEPLGSGGFGEVWKCEAPGGIFKAIKFVYGNMDGLEADSARAEEELRAVQRIKSIRHPFLLSIDRVESLSGELIIITELADRNLQEVWEEHQKAGQAGIPRRQLLDYLREAAEVLDLLNLQYDLQHLDVKPRNLFLVSNHVKVADFGLVNSLAGGGQEAGKLQLGAITPLYASPELFLGKLSRHSDQYSLAIVYQELLTGTLPFNGKNARQLLFQHTREEPGLQSLPPEDQAVVARALAKDPGQRFPSCMDFIRALQNEGTVLSLAVGDAAERSGEDDTGETVANQKADTDTDLRRPASAPAELPGYRFVECLGSSPLADQWKVEGPDGRERVVKFIYGFSGRNLEDVVLRLKSLHHPGLLPAEVLKVEPGRLILVTDLVKESLRDRWHQCVSRKMPGIMRGELVDYLRAAAEVLDYLYQQHSIQHLSLSPRHLVLDHGWVQIAEFGLAQLLWLPGDQPIAQRNSRYAAPELFDRQTSQSCDQFGLAVIYYEMLTGTHPFRGVGGPRTKGKPELDRLPATDREIIARALDPDPQQRWPNCTEMVMALEGSLSPSAKEEPVEKLDRFASLIAAPKATPVVLPIGATPGDLNQIIEQLITSAGGQVKPSENNLPVLSEKGDLLEHKFTAGLPLGSARLKLNAFNKQWYGQLLRDDEQGCVFHVSMPGNFWRQWIGRQPGLEIKVRLARVHALSATPIEVGVQIRAFRCSHKRGVQLLEEMGPLLIDSLRKHLLVNAEKRTQDRLLWPQPVKVRPVDAHGKPGEPIECRGKDISQSGMGFYLPEELETSEVLIDLPNTVHPPSVAVPATLVRAKRGADGWYEVGALFRLPALRKSMPEMCMPASAGM
jgi:serine/threonine protein kinase